MDEHWEEALNDLKIIKDLEKLGKPKKTQEDSFESSLKLKLEKIPVVTKAQRETDDEEVIDSDEELERAIRESRENHYKDHSPKMNRIDNEEDYQSEDSKGKAERSDEERENKSDKEREENKSDEDDGSYIPYDDIKPIRVMRRINPNFRAGSKVNLKNILEQQSEEYEPFGRDALNIGSVRQIVVEPMRTLNPIPTHKPAESSNDFIYFPELNGCRNLINARPVTFHWFKTFLFLSGTVSFKLKDVSPKDGILRVYFINEHLLLKANQQNQIEQHFISKAYYDRPFLCHLEAEGKFHTFACQIGLDKTKMEYYLVLLQKVFHQDSKQYIDVTVPLLSLVHIIDAESPITLYFSGEIMTTDIPPTEILPAD